jgi:hypothetical protein
MAFWKHGMPEGMFLRSPLSASHIADPNGALNIDAFLAETGTQFSTPISLDGFLQYAHWFQRKVAPDVDTRSIRLLESGPSGFRVTTEDGEQIQSRRVIVAAGPGAFAFRPPEFDDLPSSLASHSTEHRDLGRFSGQRVLVIGGGQSALENGALLHEAGARVDILLRKPSVHWLKWKGRLFKILPIGRILYAPQDVGPAGVSQLVARPDLFVKFPRKFQDWASRRSTKPAVATWLTHRLEGVPIRTSVSLKSAVPDSDHLRVTLSDGSEETCQHIMFATGFRVNLAKYSFLSPELLRSIDQVDGYPRLKAGLECSIPGLHFLGAPSGWSYGPMARFVSGTTYSPGALTRFIRDVG